MKHSQAFLFFSMTELGMRTQASPEGNSKACPFLCNVLTGPLKRPVHFSVGEDCFYSSFPEVTVTAAFTEIVVSEGASASSGVSKSVTGCSGVVEGSTVTGTRASMESNFESSWSRGGSNSMETSSMRSFGETIAFGFSGIGFCVGDLASPSATRSSGGMMSGGSDGCEPTGEREMGLRGFFFSMRRGWPERWWDLGFRGLERHRRTTEKAVSVAEQDLT